MNAEKNDNKNNNNDHQDHETEIKNGTNEAGQQQDNERGGDELYADLNEQELRELIADKDATIQQLNEQLTKEKETALRKTAELDNVKKRSHKERLNYNEEAKIEAIKKFLPLREDMQRTLEAAEELEIDNKFLEGVQLVSEKFESILEEYGVEPIEEELVPFDVDIHDAMLKQPAEDENVESNTVLKVVETGYKVGNRIIKHAKVIVSQ